MLTPELANIYYSIINEWCGKCEGLEVVLSDSVYMLINNIVWVYYEDRTFCIDYNYTYSVLHDFSNSSKVELDNYTIEKLLRKLQDNIRSSQCYVRLRRDCSHDNTRKLIKIDL